MPHLGSFMCTWKSEINSVKKDPIQPSNWVLPIHKLPFPNGIYRNGFCLQSTLGTLSKTCHVYLSDDCPNALKRGGNWGG